MSTYKTRRSGHPFVLASCAALLLGTLVADSRGAAVQAPTALEFEFSTLGKPSSGEVLLKGADATRQLNVAAKFSSGLVQDVTRRVRYAVEPVGVVQVDEAGRLSVLGDGLAVVRAKDEASGLQTELKVRVQGAKETPQVSFANRIVPIFTKAS